jgi:hypothetical protein
MPFPKDTTYPIKASLSSWNKARKGVKKDVKTGVGSKLKALEAAWNAISFADLNPANPPSDVEPAKARLAKAKAAYPNVTKARVALKAALTVVHTQSTNKALDATSQSWLSIASRQTLPLLDKRLADMGDLLEEFEDDVADAERMEMGPGGKFMQMAHVRQMWEAHLLPKVTAQDAMTALSMSKDMAWLLRAEGTKKIISFRRAGVVSHTPLDPQVEALKNPDDLGLHANRVLKDTHVAAAKLAAKNLAQPGGPAEAENDRAKRLQARLEKNAAPKKHKDDYADRLLQVAYARQAWERKGVLTVSAKDAESALKVVKDGSWLVRKEGSKTMLSARRGGQVLVQDIGPLVDNLKWPKDLRLDEAKALDARALEVARLAAKQVNKVDEFRHKLDEVRSMPGYFANLNATGAEQALANAAVGAWLVRASSQENSAAWSHKAAANKVLHGRIASLEDYQTFTKYTARVGLQLQVKA